MENTSENTIFPKGMKVEGPLKNVFSGDAWLKMLVTEPEFNCPAYDVIFEPRARNNWHVHPGGQILMIISGKGYYQEEGKPLQVVKAGDVIKSLPGVKHWHGAAPNSWFEHIGITTNPKAGDVQWLEEVTDEEYDKLMP